MFGGHDIVIVKTNDGFELFCCNLLGIVYALQDLIRSCKVMTLMRQEQNDSEFEGWEVVQIRVFTSWCNKYLSQIHKQIIRLDQDFSSGIRLIDLIQILSKAKVKYYYKYPVFKKLKLRNVSLALKLIEKQGIDVDSVGKSMFIREKYMHFALSVMHYVINMQYVLRSLAS